MRIVIAERSFFNQIRAVENIGAEVTDEELSVRSAIYIKRLVDHVRNFGVDVLPRPEVNGTLATLTASLKPSWDEESVQTRLQGLQWLAPVAVSLDQPDIPAFVTEPVMRAAIQDQFGAFAASLQRLTVSEVRPALEQCARQLLSAPVNPPTNAFEAELQSMEYEAFLAAAGKKDPLRHHNAVEEFNRREVAAVEAQRQAAHDAVWNRED